MTELLENKIDILLEKFTSMETNISSLHTEINKRKIKIRNGINK